MIITSRRPLRPNRAFTLIETLLALAILAAAGGAILTIRANAVRNSLSARNSRVAALLAEQALTEAVLSRESRAQVRRDIPEYPGFSCLTMTSAADLGQLGPARRIRVEVSYPSLGDSRAPKEVLAVETLMPPSGAKP